MKFDSLLNFYPDIHKCTIAVVGIGYVGLPLAIEFSKKQKSFLTGKDLKRKVIAFDINQKRIEELKNGFDRTNEIDMTNLSDINSIEFTSDINSIYKADVFIVTVPTPINKHKNPDLRALKSATETVAKALKGRSEIMDNFKKYTIPIVIFESTVYPGTTEEICIPIIEQDSGLTCDGNDESKTFSCGYSPERVNPGDKEHKIIDIIKVTSGSNIYVSKWINKFYGSIIRAGTHNAQSIKVAEAAKVIENTQRDINIALINELAKIFKLLDIDTLDVLDSASTKWNFMPFKPGLVGGHCIGVDPYYLTFKAQTLGYSPEVVLAGRRINDGMAKWVVDQLILEMCKRDIPIKMSKILILGFTFKENCPDVRNTKVLEIIHTLSSYKMLVDIVDPCVDKFTVKEKYNIEISDKVTKNKKYSVVVLCVAHKQFLDISLSEWNELIDDDGILFDLKGLIPRELNPLRI